MFKVKHLMFVFVAATLVALANSALAADAPAPAPAPPAGAAPAPKPEEKKPAWETTAAIGLTLTRGNSKTLLVTGNVLSEKKWDRNEVRLGADAAYGEDNDTKNTESIHGFGQYNRLFTERFYGYGRLDVLHDAIADVDYRITFSPGVGYYFIKNASTSFSGELGPGYIYEKQGDDTHSYFTLRIAERFEHKLNDRVKLWESVEYLPQVDRFENYIINAEAGIDTSITKKLSLRVFALDTYHSEPAPDREENDLKLVAAVAYKF
jgi:putative salt-induced outer membrane protein YdiY